MNSLKVSSEAWVQISPLPPCFILLMPIYLVIISGLVFIFKLFKSSTTVCQTRSDYIFQNKISVDKLKHQGKVTPGLHKLCKFYTIAL